MEQGTHPQELRAGQVPDTFHSSTLADRGITEQLTGIFRDALDRGVSDIHFEDRDDTNCVVRYRIDGELKDVTAVAPGVARAWDEKMRMRAKLSPSERTRPLDGRIHLKWDDRLVDIRMSFLPLRNGQSIVCRLLDQQNAAMPLERINMAPPVRNAFERILREPNGLVLVTGPTGSGKTTTLYSALGRLNTSSHKLITVEDPVEYRLPGACQVNVTADMGFGTALRAILRQDPDIVLVGEIRDGETARIAVQAAMTGHLVLSTLHANDAAATLTRMLDLGVDRFTLGTSLRAVMAQRLVRRLCECHEMAPPRPHEAQWVERMGMKTPALVGQPVGCDRCGRHGVRGRLPIIEMIVADRGVRAAIEVADRKAIVKAAGKQQHYRSLIHAGMDAAIAGTTTVQEIMRVASDTTRAHDPS